MIKVETTIKSSIKGPDNQLKSFTSNQESRLNGTAHQSVLFTGEGGRRMGALSTKAECHGSAVMASFDLIA